jgi:signal transduction histidine kinase
MWHEDRSLAVAIQRIERDVEALCGVPIEAVTVGDCELDEDLAALVDAAREATINAAKWSGAPVISIFAEVEDAEVSVFVRDRGKGFDVAEVAPDRKGLSESIHGRMARHGGSSAIRSAPGTGTEVVLGMPLDPKQRRTLAS